MSSKNTSIAKFHRLILLSISMCKSHDEVIQCEQQQHRYIVSFDR